MGGALGVVRFGASGDRSGLTLASDQSVGRCARMANARRALAMARSTAAVASTELEIFAGPGADLVAERIEDAVDLVLLVELSLSPAVVQLDDLRTARRRGFDRSPRCRGRPLAAAPWRRPAPAPT